MLFTANLAELAPGDDLDSRKIGRGDGIESLAASIDAHGLLAPLLVRNAPGGGYQVIAGNRRLAALRLLAERGAGWVAESAPIPCRLADRADADAHELSLVENVMRAQLHPIDEYEAFARLRDEGAAPADIAARFGAPERIVRQRLALGALHPDIREAWRSGEIEADVARAYTLCADINRQAEVYRDLVAKHWHRMAHQVRVALGDNDTARRAVALIGVDAYRAAGGVIHEDLFGDKPVIADPALATRLMQERLEAERERLLADGWGFARLADEIKDRWSYGRITPSGKAPMTDEEAKQRTAAEARLKEIEEPEDGSEEPLTDDEEAEADRLRDEIDAIDDAVALRRFGPRQKKMGGCLIGVTYDGAIEITYGLTEPKKSKPEKASAKGGDEDTPDEPAGPKLPASLTLALTTQMTVATAKALADDFDTALAVAVATLEGFAGGPSTLTHRGLPAIGERDTDGTFAGRLISEMTRERFARAVAATLDMRNSNGGGRSASDDALLSRLDRDAYERAAREAFDAEGYFKAAPAALAKAAIAEMGLKAPTGKKGDVAAFAAKEARNRGWLPEILRHPLASKGQP